MVGGCVPIVTKENGLAADLVDKSTGRVVESGNAEDLTSTLKDFISNPDHLTEMSINAKTRIQTLGLRDSVQGLRDPLTRLGT